VWIFLNNAFLSVVTAPEQPDSLLVRARYKGDLERVFGKVRVAVTPERDYRFRTLLSRGVVAGTIAAQVATVAYPNFKDSVRARWRHDAYLGVWDVMWREQQRQTPRRRPRRRAPVERWPEVNDYDPFDAFMRGDP
jgi:hypothetical protein